jgi:hypothetical protein
MKSLISALLPAATLAVLACSCGTTTKSMSEMSPDEIQSAWTTYSTPNEHHKMLEPMVGTFKATVKHRMTADAPWEESTGTCTNKWTMGNRFVETTFKGNFMGQEFDGRGYTGFDNSMGKFVGFWMDSFSTGMAPISTGTCDASGKIFTFEREYDCPITGQPTHLREVLTIKSKDEHMLEVFTQQGSDDEFQSMTITYKRG